MQSKLISSFLYSALSGWHDQVRIPTSLTGPRSQDLTHKHLTFNGSVLSLITWTTYATLCTLKHRRTRMTRKFPAWATVSFVWNTHLACWGTLADGCRARAARRRPSSSASTHEASRRPRTAPCQAWALKPCALLLIHSIKITEHEGKTTTTTISASKLRA